MEKINSLFGKFGKVENVTIEDPSDIEGYKFICDSKNIFNKDDILSCIGDVRFLILYNKPINECFLCAFRLGTSNDASIKNYMFEIVNKVNSSLRYGKYMIDDDGDVNWECLVEPECMNSDDTYKILKNFFESLLFFSVCINKERMKLQKQEESKNE